MTATRTYKITDGTTEVSLLHVGAPGFMAQRGGLQPGLISPETEFVRIYPDGAALASYSHNPAIENWRLNVRGGEGGQNEAAYQMQKLFMLLKKAREYQLTTWQNDPVWLEVQPRGEQRTRYSLVHCMLTRQDPDLFEGDFENDAEVEGIQFTIARDPFWHSHAPKAAGKALSASVTTDRYPHTSQSEADPFDTEWFVGNSRHSNDLTHIYNYDNSLTAFSGNLVNEDDFDYWVVSGSTPASGDIIYFGSTDGPFWNLVFKLTAHDMNGLTVFMEYYNGSQWIQVNDGALPAALVTLFLQDGAGAGMAKFGGISDWVATTINSVSAFWIRLRITALSAVTSAPAQDGALVFTARDNYFEFLDGQIAGDEAALAQIKLKNYAAAPDQINWIMMGMKTRGLDTFESVLNAGGDNPANWSESYGDDTASTTDGSAPGGASAQCDFAGETGLVPRVDLTINHADNLGMRGVYRIFARAKQVNGSAGDVSLRLVATYNSVDFNGDVIPMRQTGVVELVELGVFNLLPGEIEAGDVSEALSLVLRLEASAESSTPDLHVYDLILMPIDEWSAIISGLSFSDQSLNGTQMVAVDGGVQRKGAMLFNEGITNDQQQPVVPWDVAGELPALPPDRDARIYFLMASTSGSDVKFEAGNEMGLGVQISVHERWQLLRGFDGVSGLS